MTVELAVVDIAEKIAELQTNGFCVIKAHFPASLIHACRAAFQPILLDYLAANQGRPNRGPHRHFLPIPFTPPCFTPEFFFDETILAIARALMDEGIVADEWGCDVPVQGSTHQEFHIDYRRPLFPEAPALVLPTYMLVVSFGLIDIGPEHGPLEMAPGTPVLLNIGDVLIRHPWALHRGTPNTTSTPRALLTIRYVRRWYADDSREVNSIPNDVWRSLTPMQQGLLRFPVEETPEIFFVRSETLHGTLGL